MNRVLRELALFALFVVLSIVLTWPLATHLRTAVSDLGDPLLNIFLIDWDEHAFTHNPLHLYDAPFYAPGIYPLAYSENMVVITVLMLPFHLLGAAPVTLYNIAMLLGFALSGYGASVLARVCGRSIFASLVAGTFYAFCSFKFDHLAHLQIIWSGWIPLMLAALFAYWRLPSWRRAVLLGGAFVMNGLTNIHWLLFGSFTLAVTVVILALFDLRDGKYWLRLGVTLAIGSAIIIPFLIPYRVVSETYKMKRVPEEVMYFSGEWADWLVASPASLLYGKVASPEASHGERHLFPGALPLALFLAALLLTHKRASADTPPPGPRRIPNWLVRLMDVSIIAFALAAYIGSIATRYEIRVFHHRFISIDNAGTPGFYLIVAIILRLMMRMPPAFGGATKSLRDAMRRSRFTPEEWSSLIWIAIGVLGSLGLHGILHNFLYRHVEAFRSLRVPARWAIITYAGLAVWSALGVDLVLRARRGWQWSAAASAIAIVALLDVTPRFHWEQLVTDTPDVYRWLAKSGTKGPVIELPMSGWAVQFMYLFGSTAHHVPIMNGTSGFEPPLHDRLRNMAEHGEMNDVFLAELERHHAQYMIVHADWLLEQRKATMEFLREQVANGRLAFVRRFDHWTEGDWVFALTHVPSDWQNQRVPPAANQDVERFLRGDATYNTATFFHVDVPKAGDEPHGPLRVAGWALSPNGIARVRVFLDQGRRHYDAKMIDRPDVQWRWPWYPKTKHAGFQLIVPKRPKRMARETDVQVEITDGAGKVTHSVDMAITWD